MNHIFDERTYRRIQTGLNRSVFSFYIGSAPTFLYFDLYLNTAYTQHTQCLSIGKVLPLWVFPAICLYVCFGIIVYFSLSLLYDYVLAKLINK